jgi:hypothetical protein
MEDLLGARQHGTVQIAIADHAYEGPMHHDRQVADVRSSHRIGGILDRAVLGVGPSEKSDQDRAITHRLNMRSGKLCEQEIEQGSQPRFPSSSHVVNKLKEAHIQGSVVLGDASMRAQP